MTNETNETNEIPYALSTLCALNTKCIISKLSAMNKNALKL